MVDNVKLAIVYLRRAQLYPLKEYISLVFCCYQQVYKIFNVMSRGYTAGEGP